MYDWWLGDQIHALLGQIYELCVSNLYFDKRLDVDFKFKLMFVEGI